MLTISEQMQLQILFLVAGSVSVLLVVFMVLMKFSGSSTKDANDNVMIGQMQSELAALTKKIANMHIPVDNKQNQKEIVDDLVWRIEKKVILLNKNMEEVTSSLEAKFSDLSAQVKNNERAVARVTLANQNISDKSKYNHTIKDFEPLLIKLCKKQFSDSQQDFQRSLSNLSTEVRTRMDNVETRKNMQDKIVTVPMMQKEIKTLETSFKEIQQKVTESIESKELSIAGINSLLADIQLKFICKDDISLFLSKENEQLVKNFESLRAEVVGLRESIQEESRFIKKEVSGLKGEVNSAREVSDIAMKSVQDMKYSFSSSSSSSSSSSNNSNNNNDDDNNANSFLSSSSSFSFVPEDDEDEQDQVNVVVEEDEVDIDMTQSKEEETQPTQVSTFPPSNPSSSNHALAALDALMKNKGATGGIRRRPVARSWSKKTNIEDIIKKAETENASKEEANVKTDEQEVEDSLSKPLSEQESTPSSTETQTFPPSNPSSSNHALAALDALMKNKGATGGTRRRPVARSWGKKTNIEDIIKKAETEEEQKEPEPEPVVVEEEEKEQNVSFSNMKFNVYDDPDDVESSSDDDMIMFTPSAGSANSNYQTFHDILNAPYLPPPIEDKNDTPLSPQELEKEYTRSSEKKKRVVFSEEEVKPVVYELVDEYDDSNDVFPYHTEEEDEDEEPFQLISNVQHHSNPYAFDTSQFGTIFPEEEDEEIDPDTI